MWKIWKYTQYRYKKWNMQKYGYNAFRVEYEFIIIFIASVNYNTYLVDERNILNFATCSKRFELFAMYVCRKYIIWTLRIAHASSRQILTGICEFSRICIFIWIWLTSLFNQSLVNELITRNEVKKKFLVSRLQFFMHPWEICRYVNAYNI